MTVALSLLVFALGYASYFLVSHSRNIQRALSRSSSQKGISLLWVVFQRSVGVIFLGVFPGIFVLSFSLTSFSDLGLGLKFSSGILIWTLGSGACVLVICYFFSKKPENVQNFPLIRDNPWTIKTVIFNTISWLSYLFAYEFLFRGVVLLTLYRKLGLWPAIGLTTFLYALVHVPKGQRETLGAVPFGVVLGLLTIEAGSIWPAFFVHAVLALSNDFFALCAHPEIQFQRWVKSKAS